MLRGRTDGGLVGVELPLGAGGDGGDVTTRAPDPNNSQPFRNKIILLVC